MSIDAAGYRYHTGHGGVVTPNDPLDTIEEVARAYRIEWLVVERDDAVPALAPVFSGEARPRWIGPQLYGFPGRDGETSVATLPGLRQPGRPALRRDGCGGSAVSRREVLLSVAAVFIVALVVRAVAASLVVFPQPEDTAYYVGVARNLLEGHGLTSDALWSYQTPPLSFPRPAFEVWLPLPTFLAAIPMALLGGTLPGGPGELSPDRLDRAGARVAPRRRRRDRARPVARADAGARARGRTDERGVPAARPPLRPAGLNDAVRGLGPGRVPADAAPAARGRTAATHRHEADRPRVADRARRPHPQRGRVRRFRVARGGLAHPESRPPPQAHARRRACRGRPSRSSRRG